MFCTVYYAPRDLYELLFTTAYLLATINSLLNANNIHVCIHQCTYIPLMQRLTSCIRSTDSTPCAAQLYLPASSSLRFNSVSEKCELFVEIKLLESHDPCLLQAKVAVGVPWFIMWHDKVTLDLMIPMYSFLTTSITGATMKIQCL